jgi:PPM family protein phosphatase
MTDSPNEQWRAAVSRPLKTQSFIPESSAVSVEVDAASVCGKLSSQNTDHYLAVRLGRLQETLITSLAAADLPARFEEYGYAMLVADGVGGDAGARASRVALSALAHLGIQYGKWNVRVTPETEREIIEQAEFLFGQAHNWLRRASRADSRLAEMATSLTALYIADGNLFFAHVGHSSAFLLRDGVFTRLTTGHTIKQDRRATDRPRELDDTKGDFEHTETIGGRAAAPRMEIEHVKLLTGDRLLLCTNGLTDIVTPDQIADVLAPRRRPDEDCRRLIDLAVAQGSPDDVTVMVADYTRRGDPARAELSGDTPTAA